MLTGKIKCLIFVIVFFFTGICYAANWTGKTAYYILDGGSGSGTSWSDAADDLPGTMTRDYVYYIGDGSYGGHSLNTAVSSTDWIYIVKATGDDHGTETGWSSAYGDGYAEFTSALTISTSYWEINGQVGYWKGDTEAYGFRFDCDSSSGISIADVAVNNLIFEHLYFWRTDQDVDPGPRAFDFTSTTRGSSDVEIRYCYMYKVTLPFYFGVPTADGDPFWTDITVEYIVANLNHSSAGVHSEIASIRDVDDIIFRYNWFQDLEGTGGLNCMSGSCDGWEIYGNIFVGTGVGTCQGFSHGVFSDNAGGGLPTNIVFYNNTIAAQANLSGMRYSNASASGNIGRNNLWHDLDGIANVGVSTWTHNYYGADTDCTNGIYNEPADIFPTVCNGAVTDTDYQKTAVDPFTDSGNLDLSLDAATDDGFDLSSPYNQDCTDKLINGPTGSCVTRGDDGTWDRGAYEYDAGGSSETIKGITIN